MTKLFLYSLALTFFIITTVVVVSPVFADQAYCQKVGGKTDLTIHDVRNRFGGVDQSLPDTLIMQEGLAFEVIVNTNECTGIFGTEVEIRDNNSLVKRIAIPAAGSGSSSHNTIFVNWTPNAPGTHTLTFKVDPSNTIPETSESNNTLTKKIVVAPVGTRDIRFKSIRSADIASAHKGQVLHFDGEIDVLNNQKKASAMTIGWYADGKLIKTQEVDLTSITNGTIHTAFDWSTPAGKHTVSVKADIYNAIAEASDANNSGELHFTADTKAAAIDQPVISTPATLVKNKKFAEVFSVDENHCLHWIVNEAAAVHYFGSDWDQKIVSYDELPSASVFCENLSAPEVTNASEDTDHDGLSNADEMQIYHTDPTNVDTDGDGYDDGQEVRNGYNPNGAGRLGS